MLLTQGREFGGGGGSTELYTIAGDILGKVRCEHYGGTVNMVIFCSGKIS